MTRKHSEPVVSRHIELYEADWRFLQANFGPGSPEKIGVSNAIREMLRKQIKDYKARLEKRVERTGGGIAATRIPIPGLDRFFGGDPASASPEVLVINDDDEGAPSDDT